MHIHTFSPRCVTDPLITMFLVYSDGLPNLPELLRFPGKERVVNIPQEIGTKFKEFGVFLLQDRTGSRVDTLTYENNNNVERINIAILCEWLQGKGRRPVTWQTLVSTLHDTEMNTLAETIREVKFEYAE